MANYMFNGVSEQRKAAIRRLSDARVLREKRHWRGAMYLLGYSIECKLKSLLMEVHGVETLDDLEEKLSKRFKIQVRLTGKDGHNIRRLVEFTELHPRIPKDAFVAYNQCATWRVDWRYDPADGNEKECAEFFDAVDCFTRYISNNIGRGEIKHGS